MNVSTLLFRCSRILMLVAVVVSLSDRFAAQADAAIIPDGVISGTVTSSLNHAFTALGQYDAVFDAGFDQTYRHEAMVTTAGIKTRLTSVGGGFSKLIGAVVDFYTVTGGTPGAQINFNGHFRLTGNSVHTPQPPSAPVPFAGKSFVSGSVGFGLFPDGAISRGNPAINNGLGFVVGDTQPIPSSSITTFTDQDFDFSVLIPLVVTEGQQFQLSFSTFISHTAGVKTDMFNTATVSFDLPAGMTITSTKGFLVPEPSTLTLAALGVLGIGWRRRKRAW